MHSRAAQFLILRKNLTGVRGGEFDGRAVGFRALQGIGAGALTPVVFTLVGDLYQGEHRARVQGMFASV
jgi:hypothetical protein